MNQYLAHQINQYKINKTLRFALRPEYGTKDFADILKQDEILAGQYKIAKKIIDEYHRDFIDRSLSQFAFSQSDLAQYQDAYEKLKKAKDKTDDTLQKTYSSICERLRKQVAKALPADRLFKKELIQKDLPAWLETHAVEVAGTDNPAAVIKEFEKYTTYFGGFNENRKNIYAAEDEATAIAHRIVHTNLPIFLENRTKYLNAKEYQISSFEEVEKELALHEGNHRLDDVFELAFFNQCLTQDGIDYYNLVIGGKTIDGGSKIQGVNEKINLHAQQIASNEADAKKTEQTPEKGITSKQVRACKMQELKKQILSKRHSFSFRQENLTTDAELSQLILERFAVNGQNEIILKRVEADPATGEERAVQTNLSQELKACLETLSDADLNHVYLRNDTALSTVSNQIFKDWRIIPDGLALLAQQKFPGEKKKDLENRQKWLNQPYLSFEDIHQALALYFTVHAEDIQKVGMQGAKTDRRLEQEKRNQELAANKPLVTYFQNLITTEESETGDTETRYLLNPVARTFHPAKTILEECREVEREELKNNKERVKIIKAFLDAVKDVQTFLKPLRVKPVKERGKTLPTVYEEDAFYLDFNTVYDQLALIIPLYNQTRNYLTKKPFSEEKFKLNFENPSLAAGWDRNKETDNTTVLFQRDGQYYLGIMHTKHRKLFEDLPAVQDPESAFQKVDYKLLPGPNKMLPKVFFAPKNEERFAPSEEIQEIRNVSSHTKNGTAQEGCEKAAFDLSDCRRMIDFFKASIAKHEDWKQFGFQFSPTESYGDISEFYREVAHQGYRLTFRDVDEAFIKQAVAEKKLFFFRIYNKDFSEKTKGTPNLHTLYWRTLFSPENLRDVVYKLDGEAELFYRKASLKYSAEIMEKGHHAEDPKKKQPYPIIKDRRYTKDQFQFHVPITLNFKAEAAPFFNSRLNSHIKGNRDVNIIGIDRGERHLIYISVINQNGDIIEQYDLDSPLKNHEHKAAPNYQEKLDRAEQDRAAARKSWDTINQIKDLKSGYLSQVIHIICRLMVKHNAVIAMENLNFGFKRGRFKVEKQVYQKFEHMLIDKLNLLVFKDRKPAEDGSALRPYQLTDKFESFQKIGKQTGAIFYVPAYHTSKICPATGFVNLIYPKYTNLEKAREFFQTFEAIRYNPTEDYVEFVMDYQKFGVKANKQTYTVCTHGERIITSRNADTNNHWDYQTVEPTKKLKELFEKHGISYASGQDLKQTIVLQSDTDFHRGLIKWLRVTLQLRNSDKDSDYIISPVRDTHGNFFDSRNQNTQMPVDSDANGAYHIALKGLMILKRIHQWDPATDDKGKYKHKLNLDITNDEWYAFAREIAQAKPKGT